jgi:hypothetical protein
MKTSFPTARIWAVLRPRALPLGQKQLFYLEIFKGAEKVRASNFLGLCPKSDLYLQIALICAPSPVKRTWEDLHIGPSHLNEMNG